MPRCKPERSPSSAIRCRRVPTLPWAQVEHGRRALARLSANFYGRPAEKLAHHGHHRHQREDHDVIPAERDAARGGRKTALVGTVEYRIEDEVFPRRTPRPRRWS